MSDSACRFRVSNRSGADSALVVEPWGRVYPFPAGKSYTVVVSGDLAQPFEVEWREDDIVVYALDEDRSSTVAVYDGLRELE